MIHDNAWTTYTKKDLTAIEKLSKDYMDFLDKGKTERECTDLIVETAKKNGYKDLDEIIKNDEKLTKGSKIYAVNMDKAVMLLNIGEDIIGDGMNVLGAHIDSPRLDIKQSPLYESEEFAYLDTHYYGGIKKYQWVTLPLALHGVVVKKDGTTVLINIGEEADDPVFFVSDLLIHLAGEQMDKKAAKVIEGEALDIIIGNKPIKLTAAQKKAEAAKAGSDPDEEKKDPFTREILRILKEQYDIEEEDFLSAEIEVVPAGKSRDAGFDRSMILGYGHDDRVCAFSSMEAMLAIGSPKRTTCCILVDKEEIGSVGATGMRSRFFENSVAELMELCGGYRELPMRRALAASRMLSSDVSAGFDPTYASCFEKKNAAFLGHGMVFNKFTGARGKSGSNDANAEYMALIRRIMDEGKVCYQTAELGKVDLGGGGTIAYILSLYGMDVIDCGVAVLNMHAPWEAISKADLYETFRGYQAFLKSL